MMKAFRCLGVANLITFLSMPVAALASPGNSYLEYKEPAAAGGGFNWLSTAAYMLTLLIVFAVVLWAAYSVSQWFGGRMHRLQTEGGAAVVSVVSLGGSRQVVMLKVGERILVLGVTDQQVNLLQEINDEEQVKQLLQQNRTMLPGNAGATLFSEQLLQLDELEKHLPKFIRRHRNH